MSQKQNPQIDTRVTKGNATSAPGVQLVTPSTTQIPIHSVTAISYSAGEQPIHWVKMKDGTVVPMAENLIAQSGGNVMF